MPAGGRLLIHAANAWLPVGDAPALQQVRIAVTDTGERLADRVRRRSTEPLVPLSRRHGQGQRHATVTSMLEQCGGRLRILSDEDRGTTFAVLLPAAEAPPRR